MEKGYDSSGSEYISLAGRPHSDRSGALPRRPSHSVPASGCCSAVFTPIPPSAGHDNQREHVGGVSGAAVATASGGRHRQTRREEEGGVDVVVVVGGFGGHGAIHA